MLIECDRTRRNDANDERTSGCSAEGSAAEGHMPTTVPGSSANGGQGVRYIPLRSWPPYASRRGPMASTTWKLGVGPPRQSASLWRGRSAEVEVSMVCVESCEIVAGCGCGRRGSAGLLRERVLLWITVGGLATVAGCGLVVAKLLDDLLGSDGLVRFDPWIMSVVNHRSSSLTDLARVATWFGDPWVVVVVTSTAVIGCVALRKGRLAVFIAASTSGAAIATRRSGSSLSTDPGRRVRCGSRRRRAPRSPQVTRPNRSPVTERWRSLVGSCAPMDPGPCSRDRSAARAWLRLVSRVPRCALGHRCRVWLGRRRDVGRERSRRRGGLGPACERCGSTLATRGGYGPLTRHVGERAGMTSELATGEQPPDAA